MPPHCDMMNTVVTAARLALGCASRGVITMLVRVSWMLRLALLTFLSGAVLLSIDSASAPAQAQRGEHKLTLRAIMSELGAEYMRLANTLLLEDFKGLEESAKAIQGHPLPPEIVTAIKRKLPASFRGFERVDEQSHQAAADLARRAAAKDISGSAKAFGRLGESCVSCHKQFRATLRSLSD